MKLKLPKEIATLISERQLPGDYRELVEGPLLVLAQQVIERQAAKQAPLVLGVNGAQGTGKSTLCVFLKLLLEDVFGHGCAILSIDDFYLSREQRKELAEHKHPLLVTRGVPGTHDLALANATFKALLASEPVALPRFNKAADNPYPPEQWPLQEEPVDFVLFEGWCVAARAQPDAALAMPVNSLEADADPEGHWRQYVNEQLKTGYRQLFNLLDYLVMLKAPSFDCVYEWRSLQEQQLAARNQGDGIMDKSQLERFIQHYERITRHTLAEMPARADGLLELAQDHRIIRTRGALFEPCEGTLDAL